MQGLGEASKAGNEECEASRSLGEACNGVGEALCVPFQNPIYFTSILHLTWDLVALPFAQALARDFERQ